MRKQIGKIVKRQNQWIDSLTERFENELFAISEAAKAFLLDTLRTRLSFEDGGSLKRTAANTRTLARVDEFMMDSLNKAGYQLLADEFVGQFSGGFRFLGEMLDVLSEQMQRPLERRAFAPDDARALQDRGVRVSAQLDAIAEGAAANFKRRALFEAGALGYRDMVLGISEAYARTLTEAKTLAATAVVMQTRDIQARGMELAEKEAGALLYRYEGPDDKLNRPFCDWAQAQKPMTRKQIDALDRRRIPGVRYRENGPQGGNGQLANVLLTCGGYGCRHTFAVDGFA